jgi:peptidoglycan/LPS O-acetylase OafA/YrhL
MILARRRFPRLIPTLAMLVACLAAFPMTAYALSHWPDTNFTDSFDGVANGPGNDAAASRFLTQATFGPTAADIAQLSFELRVMQARLGASAQSPTTL